MPPAIAGVGRYTNSMGTTKNPMVLRLTHHRAATNTGKRDIKLNVTDRHHFIALNAAGCLNFCSITLLLANQRAGDRAANIH